MQTPLASTTLRRIADPLTCLLRNDVGTAEVTHKSEKFRKVIPQTKIAG